MDSKSPSSAKQQTPQKQAQSPLPKTQSQQPQQQQQQLSNRKKKKMTVNEFRKRMTDFKQSKIPKEVLRKQLIHGLTIHMQRELKRLKQMETRKQMRKTKGLRKTKKKSKKENKQALELLTIKSKAINILKLLDYESLAARVINACSLEDRFVELSGKELLAKVRDDEVAKVLVARLIKKTPKTAQNDPSAYRTDPDEVWRMEQQLLQAKVVNVLLRNWNEKFQKALGLKQSTSQSNSSNSGSANGQDALAKDGLEHDDEDEDDEDDDEDDDGSDSSSGSNSGEGKSSSSSSSTSSSDNSDDEDDSDANKAESKDPFFIEPITAASQSKMKEKDSKGLKHSRTAPETLSNDADDMEIDDKQYRALAMSSDEESQDDEEYERSHAPVDDLSDNGETSSEEEDREKEATKSSQKKQSKKSSSKVHHKQHDFPKNKGEYQPSERERASKLAQLLLQEAKARDQSSGNIKKHDEKSETSSKNKNSHHASQSQTKGKQSKEDAANKLKRRDPDHPQVVRAKKYQEKLKAKLEGDSMGANVPKIGAPQAAAGKFKKAEKPLIPALKQVPEKMQEVIDSSASWQAKRKIHEQSTQIHSFKGTKIEFNDDD